MPFDSLWSLRILAPAVGWSLSLSKGYTTPGSGINQVRLTYVLCKEDIQRALMILEKAIEEYNAIRR